MMHPNFKWVKEMRERLQRYGILSLHNMQHESYSLKFVKVPEEDIEQNPILQKGKEFKVLNESMSENAIN